MEGIDPVVERVIQHCMEKDPSSRPSSVAQLAQALPGMDPLAAAIAAGETPSPEMVAASGSKEGLRPPIAWGILACIIVGLVAALVLKDHVSLHRRIPFDKSPEALVERSRLFLNKLGFTEKFEDSAYGFIQNSDLLRHIEASDQLANRWNSLDSKAILFWYRQSPRNLGILGLLAGSTAPDNPPLQYSGEILIMLDTEGRLLSFRGIPPQKHSKTEAAPPDWKLLFSESGLDMDDWTPTDPQWNPLSNSDTRSAWTGSLPNRPATPVRIEAAAFQGKPVSFEIIGPWTRAVQMESVQIQWRGIIAIIAAGFLFLPAIFGGIFFARRNMKLGRGDHNGAMRLALFVLALYTAGWILALPQISFVNLLIGPYLAVLTWILYMAIEPFVRRRWPQILVSWTRLFSGEWRDPLVARDTFVGSAFGVLAVCIVMIIGAIPSPLFWAGFNPFTISLNNVLGARFAISFLLLNLLWALFAPLIFICLLVTMRILLRNQNAAITIATIILIGTQASQVGPLVGLITACVVAFMVMRFGLLVVTFYTFSLNLIGNAPMTLQASAWYSRYGYLALAIFAAIVLNAFRTSLGGRPIFGTPRFDE